MWAMNICCVATATSLSANRLGHFKYVLAIIFFVINEIFAIFRFLIKFFFGRFSLSFEFFFFVLCNSCNVYVCSCACTQRVHRARRYRTRLQSVGSSITSTSRCERMTAIATSTIDLHTNFLLLRQILSKNRTHQTNNYGLQESINHSSAHETSRTSSKKNEREKCS